MNRIAKNTDTRRFISWLSYAVIVGLVFGAVAVFGLPVSAQDSENVDSYIYTVEDGDNWDSVSAKTGVSVEDLQAANPDAVRDSGWLLTDEQLTIPLSEETPSTTHTVDAGESWSTIADDYGLTVEALQAANQRSVRTGMILYKGERLLIPPAQSEQEMPEAGEPETEEAGDTTAVAEEPSDEVGAEEEIPAGEPATEAGTTEEAGNDEAAIEEPAIEEPATGGAVGMESEEEVEPETESSAAETAQAGAVQESAEGDEQAAEQEMVEATPTEPALEAEQPAAEITATVPMTETVIDAEVPSVGEPVPDEMAVGLPECPESLADYPDTVVAVLDANEGSAEALGDFLTGCEASVEDGIVATDLTGDGFEDLVIVYRNPGNESAFVESDLIIVSPAEDGYEVTYRARAAGEVRLLSTEDVNTDGQSDVIWIDTTCGASTCFDTVNVRSWDGSVWADWTDGTITMAYADIELTDALPDVPGEEIQLTGGIYGSVGAGPQRSRTETWASEDGAPYALADKVYSDSECLYHTVLDANRALTEAEAPEDLEAVAALYERAATDESLIKCWVRPLEVEELRSFSLFRLAVVDAYEGDMEGATDRITEMVATYPDGLLGDVAETWLDSVESGDGFSAACEAVTAYAEDHPEVWEFLADYGYTNPSFEANELCPPPDIATEDSEAESDGNGATGTSPRSDLDAETEATQGGPAATESEADTQFEAIAAIAENLPDCPAALSEYADVLPAVLTESAGDSDIVERWMHACGALMEDRGAVLTADLDGNGTDDFVVLPTLVSDIGLGPDGVQGAVLFFHGDSSGTYELVASPEVFGKPVPLAIEDLNGDGDLDIAWTVESCSTFCVLEAKIMTWDGDQYSSLIEPGAAIASGQAAFEDGTGANGATGKTLMLSGGVSGTPEGGLTVSHEEIWQSFDAAPFQRVDWEYDRTAEGSNCLGLRLVEADVALQAAGVLGYGPAFEKYAQALEPDLEACSIFGLQPDDELALLQGLAHFRFIEVQALDEDLDGARASLNYFAELQGESPYVQAASQWLDEYSLSGDAVAACDGISSILEENADMWQITDHFGYNHPALAAEQVCYVPDGS